MNIKKGIAAALLLGLLVMRVMAVKSLRPFVRVHPQGTDGCRLVEAPGSWARKTWVRRGERHAVDLRRQSSPDPRHRPRQGQVFRYHPDRDSARRSRCRSSGPTDFRPHGMGLWRDASGLRLFIVQHGDAASPSRSSPSSPSRPTWQGPASPPAQRDLARLDQPKRRCSVGPESFTPAMITAGVRRFPCCWKTSCSCRAHRWPTSTGSRDASFFRSALQQRHHRRSRRAPARGRRGLAERVSVFARRPDGGLDKLSTREFGTAVDNFAQDEAGPTTSGLTRWRCSSCSMPRG